MASLHPKVLSVVGFQFEPERSQADVSNTYDDAGSDDDRIYTESRSHLDVSKWCKCGKYKDVATEKESVCCADIDEIKYFHLNGMVSVFLLIRSEAECFTMNLHICNIMEKYYCHCFYYHILLQIIRASRSMKTLCP